MRLGFMLSEVWNGLRRNLSMAISIILVTMVSMFLLGLGLLTQRQAETMQGYWYDRIQVSIYLCQDGSNQANCQGKAVTDAQSAAIRSQLEQMPEVKQVFFESEQQAYDRFREQFRNSPIAANIKLGDIPSSYRVQLKDASKFDVVSSQFEGAPGVATVQDQKKVLEKVFTFFNGLTIGAVALAGLMVLCSALLMVTTIRQVAFARRREIGIMRLVGASNATIRVPFVVEVLVAGLTGGAAAVGLLWATVHYLVSGMLRELFNDQAFIGDSDVLLVAPWMIGGVAALAVLTAVVTLWRYLRV